MSASPSPAVRRSAFGATRDGARVELFTLTSDTGIEVCAASYGGIITAIRAPDRSGAPADIVLGFDGLEGYLGDHPYFGAVVGRYANRIAKGRLPIDGRTFRLATNEGPNHMHGGARGFDTFVWDAEPVAGATAVRFSRLSPDGEEGYPGSLRVEVTYRLSGHALIVEYRAVTDQPTVINLTQHTYFNLAGHGAGDILDHELMIGADHYTPTDDTQIPTGELAPVDGTPFDFRIPSPIGSRVDANHPQLRAGRGYDHNWVLAGTGDSLRPAARVVEPATGRTLEVRTTEPGVQFYSGNLLDGSLTGKEGARYGARTGFCLETQHFPDSPNQPAFPSTALRPGEEYRSTTMFTFGVAP